MPSIVRAEETLEFSILYLNSGLGLRGNEFLNHSKNIGWLPSSIEQSAWKREPIVWLFLDNHSLNLGASF